ncbi:phosphoglycerate kinase [Candidatus Uhrbacteria bacterium]|nr:phosphoglycerate kinase [Candidatus Uhrbacteria bacterium]
MRLHTFRCSQSLKGKRILVRIDGNVPVKRGVVVDGPQGKIARVAVDLEWLRQQGARLVVMTHLGRPEGKRMAAYTVAPVAKRLSELLGVPVRLSREVVGPKAEQMAVLLQDGDVLLLENLRFHPGEERNSRAFAQQLAALGDLYINDAFAVSHRAHASVDAVTEELTSYAGPLLAHEVGVLAALSAAPKPPVVLVMGGLKMDTKLPVLERFLPKVDAVLIGGALAHAFFVAQKKAVGRSAYDPEGVAVAKRLLRDWSGKIHLPVDVAAASRLSSQAVVRHVSCDRIGAGDYAVDVGHETLKVYEAVLQGAKTIIWNGPFGYCEVPKFAEGTRALARMIAARTGKAKTVVGGGDTVPILEDAQLMDKFSLVSTGGGAMLEFLAGKKLPGLVALET